MKFSPQLLPNNKAGVSVDWETILTPVENYLVSNKADGGRVELFADGRVLGRSLKEIPSAHIQRMAKDISLILQLPETSIIEAEFYSPEMTFAEIMHFFRSEDVTSPKNIEKYKKLWAKTKEGTTDEWEFKGRDWQWLTTWHESLKFYAFGYLLSIDSTMPFSGRYQLLDAVGKVYTEKMSGLEPDLIIIPQHSFTEIDEIYQAYDQAIISGYEGLVIMHKESLYKHGRHSLNSGMAYKMKEDNLQFDGVILSLEEGTEVIEGVAKKTNELGRSVTSKLKEHRTPSGLCKGLLVRMDNGLELTVSLKGFDHPARRAMLLDPSPYIGQTIRFTGMAPVKEGGAPRHAHFSAGNIRDSK